MTISTKYFVLGTLMAIATAPLSGQSCSAATTVGKYYILCEGQLSPAPNAPMVPVKILGTSISDYDGNIQGKGTINLGGQILSQVVKGKENVNADCTGSVTYTQILNGQPGPPLGFTFFISEQGERIDGLSTDAGTVLSCVLKRTSKSILASTPPRKLEELATAAIISTRPAEPLAPRP